MTGPINNNLNLNFNLNNISSKPAGFVEKAGENVQQQIQSFIGQNLTPRQPIFDIFNPMFSSQAVLMEKEVVLKYLQNLMNLPETVEKFIKELQQNPKLAKILNENLVNVKVLNELLTQNSNDAIQKLMQTIASMSKSGIKDTEQMREIVKLLGAIQNNTINNSTSIKEFLLLYIPLNIQEYNKNVNFAGFEAIEEGISNQDLILMIETVNYSNILCILNFKDGQIFADFYCSSEFPHLKYSKIMSEVSKELNILPSFEFKILKNVDVRNNKQNFTAQTNGTIPTNVLILAHVIIKIIFKLDDNAKNEGD